MTTFSPQVELNLAGTWTDVTSYVYNRDSIRITQGQADETSQVQAGTCQFTVNNRDGRFSPRNPTGAYYGSIGRNTPVRVSLPCTSSYAWFPGEQTSYLQTPDSASLSITGDIDIRAELELENWHQGTDVVGGVLQKTTIASKYANTSSQGSWIFSVEADGQLRFAWTTDGTVGGATFFSSSVYLPVPGSGKLAVRVTMDVNNGSGGYTITYYTSDSISGTWTQIEQVVTTSGTTSIFNSTAPLQIGSISDLDYATYGYGPCLGRVTAFKMYSGIAGSLVADVDLTSLSDGATSFTDGSGNNWTVVGNAEILKREFRFVGEVSSWPSTWDTGGFDVYVTVTANGIMRRLGQGQRPLQSTLRRRIPSFSPLAYWPLEDGSSSTQGANAVADGSPLSISGATFAATSTLPGSAPLPTISSGTVLSGPVPPPASSLTGWSVVLLYYLATGPATQRTILRFTTSGNGYLWSLTSGTGGSTITITDNDGSTVATQGIATGTDIFGQWIQLTISASVSGGTITWSTSWTKLDGSAGSTSGTYSGTLGRPTQITTPTGGYNADLDGMSIGHIAVFGTSTTTAYNGAFDGYSGEYASERLARLADEESVQISTFGAYDQEELVGPQQQTTLLELCRDVEDADGGVLYERRTMTALGYRDRNTLVNQDALFSLSYTNHAVVAPLQPAGDDFLVRNDVTVSRLNGSSATQTDTTSALSVNDPPSGVGDYSTEYQLNLSDDSRLDYIAGWLLHLGTWDEERYPQVNIAVHNDTTLQESLFRLGVGDRFTLTDLPAWMPPGDVDLMVVGYTETLDQFLWNITLTCIPYGPWLVAVTDDATYGRADTEGSELAADATSSATTLSVSTTSGPLWTTSAGDFPFDVTVGGEQVTVTNITGSSSPQTFTVTRSVNGVVKAQTTGTTLSLTHPAYTAL